MGLRKREKKRVPQRDKTLPFKEQIVTYFSATEMLHRAAVHGHRSSSMKCFPVKVYKSETFLLQESK